MRLYLNALEATREIERDMGEMGIRVHPATMQDKDVADDPDYDTLEVRGYGFQLQSQPGHQIWNPGSQYDIIDYLFNKDSDKREVVAYIDQEHLDRTGGVAMNPGNAYLRRPGIWDEFLHDGKFHYTYSERIGPQLPRVIDELRVRSDTRQAIINIHSNICPTGITGPGGTALVDQSNDLLNMGGSGRVPCSMYYQLMVREGKVDLIYTMRSCDFLTHFPIDFMLALKMQTHVANLLGRETGLFTYFTGSMHAYAKDIKDRDIF